MPPRKETTMATIAKHVDNYAKYVALAGEALDDLKTDDSQHNWRSYDRQYDRLQASAQVLIDLGIDVKGYLGFPDPHTL